MRNTPKFHLEVSGRATGKTYNLIQDIIEKQKREPNINIYIASHSHRMYKYIIEKIEQQGGDIKKCSYLTKMPTEGGACYFDDFEWIDWLTPDNVEELCKRDAYFTTAPKRLRTIHNFSPENDVLAKLIQLNNGIVIKRNWITLNNWETMLEHSKQLLTEEQFNCEYLANYLK